MKGNILVLVFLSCFLCTCQSTAEEKTPSTEQSEQQSNTATQNTKVQNGKSGTKAINTELSNIYWKGYKILGEHAGNIKLKKGNIIFEQGLIKKGSFVVDMTSIEVSDTGNGHPPLKDGKEADREELAVHLMSEDFFNTNQFPEASFVILDAQHRNGYYQIKGQMSINGVSKTETLEAIMTENVVKAQISIDRTAYGIQYDSNQFFDNLGDRAIKDQFDLQIKIVL